MIPLSWPIAPYGPWETEDGNSASQWITAGQYGASSATPGDYVYQTSFNLTGKDLSTVVIDGEWAADNNGVDILVNGHSTGYSTPFQDFQFHRFSISGNSYFLAGANTISFKVHNGGSSPNPTGIRVQFDDLRAVGKNTSIYSKLLNGDPVGDPRPSAGGKRDFGEIKVIKVKGRPDLEYAIFIPGFGKDTVATVIKNLQDKFDKNITKINFFQVAVIHDDKGNVENADIPGFKTASGTQLKFDTPFVDSPKNGLLVNGKLYVWADDRPGYYNETEPDAATKQQLGTAYKPELNLDDPENTFTDGLIFSDAPRPGPNTTTTFYTWVVAEDQNGKILLGFNAWVWSVTTDDMAVATVTSFLDDPLKVPDQATFVKYLNLFGQ